MIAPNGNEYGGVILNGYIEKIAEELAKRKDELIFSKMSKFEKWLYKHIKSEHIKRFALRKSHIEIEGYPFNPVAKIYRGNICIGIISAKLEAEE